MKTIKIPRPYIERGQAVPPHLIESLEMYVNQRIETGSFLRAALENNFKEAAIRSDHISGSCLTALALLIMNELPEECQGSAEKVAVWLDDSKPTIGYYSNQVVERLIDDTYDAKHAVELVTKYSEEVTVLYFRGTEEARVAKLILHLEKSNDR